MTSPPGGDPLSQVFDRVTSLAADTAELRDRESAELQTLALALADYAREHPLTDLPPLKLSPRAGLQARFSLSGVPAYIGDGFYLAPNGSVVVKGERAMQGAAQMVSLAMIIVSGAALFTSAYAIAGVLVGLAVIPGESLVNGGAERISHFRPITASAERGALAVLRRTLDRLEREVRGTNRLT